MSNRIIQLATVIIFFFVFGLGMDYFFDRDASILQTTIRAVIVGCVYVAAQVAYFRFKSKRGLTR